MAFSVRVMGIGNESGEAILSVEPPWWNCSVLKEDARFTESNATGSFRDYCAALSVKETAALHEAFRSEATSGIFASPDWQVRIAPIMDKLDDALYKDSDMYINFRICVYEWESGFQ